MNEQNQTIEPPQLTERDRVLMSPKFKQLIKDIEATDERYALVRLIKSSSATGVYKTVNERIEAYFLALQESNNLQDLGSIKRLIPIKGEGEVKSADGNGLDLIPAWIQPSSVRKFLLNRRKDAISLKFFRCFLVAFTIPLDEWPSYYTAAKKPKSKRQLTSDDHSEIMPDHTKGGWKPLLSVFSLLHHQPKLMDSQFVNFLKKQRLRFNGIGMNELLHEVKQSVNSIRTSNHDKIHINDETGTLLYHLGGNYEFLKQFFYAHEWFSFSRILADHKKIAMARLAFQFSEEYRTCMVQYFRREGSQEIKLEGGLRYKNGHLFILLKDTVGFKFITMEMDKVCDKTMHGYACTEHHSTETSVKELFFGLPVVNKDLIKQTDSYVEKGFMPYIQFREYEGILPEDKFSITNRRNSILRYPSHSTHLFERFSASKFSGEYVVIMRHPYEMDSYIAALLTIDSLTTARLKTISIDYPDTWLTYIGYCALLNATNLMQISMEREASSPLEIRKAEMMLEIIRPHSHNGQKQAGFKGKNLYMYDDIVRGQSLIAFRHSELDNSFTDVTPSDCVIDKRHVLYKNMSALCEYYTEASLTEFFKE